MPSNFRMKVLAAVAIASSTFVLSASTAPPSSAQVCPSRKEKSFLAALQKVDQNTTELSCLTHPRKRVWTSGYKLVTPGERVQFALDYQDFLVSQGETGVITDFYVVPVIPYKERLSFAYRWWSTTDKTYEGRPKVDDNWVHDALVDAGNSIHLACQTLAPMHADRIAQNQHELDDVDNRKVETHAVTKGK